MSILQKSVDKTVDLILWIRDWLADDDVVNAIKADLGIAPDVEIKVPELPQEALDSLQRYRNASNPNHEAFLEAFDDLIVLIEAIAKLKDENRDLPEAVVNSVLGLLVTNWARFNLPFLYWSRNPCCFWRSWPPAIRSSKATRSLLQRAWRRLVPSRSICCFEIRRAR